MPKHHNKPYIIVGDGFAGLCMALELLKNKKPFLLFAQTHQAASRQAAGVVNPVILKYFTMIHQHQCLMSVFAENIQAMSDYLGRNIFEKHLVSRVFANEYEQESWLKKSHHHQLKYYLNPEVTYDELLQNPHGMSSIYASGRLKVDLFFELMEAEILKENQIIEAQFDYQALDLSTNTYQDQAFEKIIFCEGLGMRHNPFFKHVPLQVNKGHCLKLTLSEPLKQALIYKNRYFLFEESPGKYYYGGTNDNDNFEAGSDEIQQQELEHHLKSIYPKAYKIEKLAHGYRPMPTDRRVILGKHHQHHQLYIFNGLGARGILNAVCYAPVLYDHIINGKVLEAEIDVKRYLSC